MFSLCKGLVNTLASARSRVLVSTIQHFPSVSTKRTIPRLVALNNLQNLPGAKKRKIRVGRGTGSGRGKLCRFGHQKSRVTPRGFEGGQTPLYKRLPKFGFKRFNKFQGQYLNLDTIQNAIEMGKLSVKTNTFTTMRDLLQSKVISRVGEGVKLLAGDAKIPFKTPIHLEVSYATPGAIKAIEAAGGTVTCVHLNKLALRALLRPYKYEILPRRSRPSPKKIEYYLNGNRCGYLSPEIQIRNLKLFGTVTSEQMYRQEHEHFMNFKRFQLKKQRETFFGSKEKMDEIIARRQRANERYLLKRSKIASLF